jgi:hypothetical protein
VVAGYREDVEMNEKTTSRPLGWIIRRSDGQLFFQQAQEIEVTKRCTPLYDHPAEEKEEVVK